LMAEVLRHQNIPVAQVTWSPPAGGDPGSPLSWTVFNLP
jgi:hypothetical protein